VGSFDEFRADARATLALARAELPSLPVFLLGHSQGGLVAATLALREPEGLSGLALSSPLLGIAPRSRPSLVRAVVGRILASVLPRALFATEVDAALLSRDPAVGKAYAADPLVSHAVSAGWYHALQLALAEAHERAPSLCVPTLVLYAGEDALVDPQATGRWVARAPRGQVEAFCYDRLYHEILNAPEKEQIRRRIEAWIRSKASSLPPAESR
jgi:alpha-beta hydrolase superfamily lysophospholipase